MTGGKLSTLRVVYRCKEGAAINEKLDADIRILATKYGVSFWAGGVNLESGERDQCFDNCKVVADLEKKGGEA